MLRIIDRYAVDFFSLLLVPAALALLVGVSTQGKLLIAAGCCGSLAGWKVPRIVIRFGWPGGVSKSWEETSLAMSLLTGGTLGAFAGMLLTEPEFGKTALAMALMVPGFVIMPIIPVVLATMVERANATGRPLNRRAFRALLLVGIACLASVPALAVWASRKP